MEGVYWRGEEPWVRMRSRLGTCWSVPWRHTDLPLLIPPAVPQLPLLSPQALLELARHLKRPGRLSSRQNKKPASV